MTLISKTFSLTTFGCQMNMADSSRIRGILASMGYVEAGSTESAQLVIFNTCTVRDHAEQRLIGRIRSLAGSKRKNPDLRVVVAGCMAQRMQDELLEQLPMVDLILGPNDIENLPHLLEKASTGRCSGEFIQTGSFDGDSADGVVLEKPYSAFVNIIRGCTNFCSYCIVPSVRGPEISRPPEQIIEFVAELAARGVTEITLLGQNVNAYGKDLGINEGFAALLEEIDKIEGIRWIRFMTSHPRDFSFSAVERMAGLKKLCTQFHLPVQAGSDRILQLMRRGYTVAQFVDLIKLVRSNIKDVTVTTDIICGFPTETEKEFEGTMRLVGSVRFDSAFMYYFSPRSGTDAAEMGGQLPLELRKRRLAELIEVQNGISLQISRGLIGRGLEVLVDKPTARSDGHLTGKTSGGRAVDFKGAAQLVGSYQKVIVEKARNWTLSGKLSV